MDGPILFIPDNRLLGSAIGDLGMYGGQSDARFSVGEARDASAVSVEVGGNAEDVVDLSSSSTSLPFASEVDTAMAMSGPVGAGALATQPFLIAPAAIDFAPVQHVAPGEASAPADWHSIATGAGSLTPIVDAGEHAVAEAAVDTLSESPLIGPATGLLDHLADGPVGGGVAGLGETVTGMVGGLLGGTLGLVEGALDGLAGSDPQGGIDTLVNLVSISDTFDLTPVVAPLLETVGDTGQALADTLIGEDSLVGTLLGGDHHDDGLLGGHIAPEHPLGL